MPHGKTKKLRKGADNSAKAMKTKNQKHIFNLCFAATVAALYVVLTLISGVFGLSSGVIQVRFSEALCILPVFSASAIPGLTIGCLISNILTSGNPLDVIFGTLATFIGSVGGYFLRKFKWLIPLPTVIANAVIIPLVIFYGFNITDSAIPFLILTVGLGEFIAAYILGMLLLITLRKKNIFGHLGI